MANGDTKTEQLLDILGNGGDASALRGCCNTKTQNYILDAIDRAEKIEEEIEVIKAASDAVDVVGTKDDLDNYDTSKLNDNDIVTVLQDEEHDNMQTYYRWNKSTGEWSYIGGKPNVKLYDTTGDNVDGAMTQKAATDALNDAKTELNDKIDTKQDILIAGEGISISEDGKTISLDSNENFKVKQWNIQGLNINIPTCTTDIPNTGIDKMTYKITGQEATDYQIVGMVAYQLRDTNDDRINCWPVCQFTGNGQTELNVRWMCGGTQPKVAARIDAWVLLKHR